MRAQHPLPESPIRHDAPCFREKLFGTLELLIIAATILAVLIHPHMIMLIAVTAAGFIVVALAALDDYFRSHS